MLDKESENEQEYDDDDEYEYDDDYDDEHWDEEETRAAVHSEEQVCAQLEPIGFYTENQSETKKQQSMKKPRSSWLARAYFFYAFQSSFISVSITNVKVIWSRSIQMMKMHKRLPTPLICLEPTRLALCRFVVLTLSNFLHSQ